MVTLHCILGLHISLLENLIKKLFQGRGKKKIVFCFQDNLLLDFIDYRQLKDSLYELGVADRVPFIAKMSNVDV
jgi:hypothetical protein